MTLNHILYPILVQNSKKMFILKVYIYLPCIKTQQQTTAPFDDTSAISSSNHQTTGLYQGSDDCCEGDHNSALICLLQKSQAIHYCNQSVLVIVPDLKIVFSQFQYSALTRDNGDHKDAMLVPNKICRTLAPSSYTNISHVVN